MSVTEVSRYLAMDEQTVARLAVERRIPALEHNGQWLFSRKSIDKWRLLRQPAEPGRETAAPTRATGA